MGHIKVEGLAQRKLGGVVVVGVVDAGVTRSNELPRGGQRSSKT
jgi:hypothetical protein